MGTEQEIFDSALEDDDKVEGQVPETEAPAKEPEQAAPTPPTEPKKGEEAAPSAAPQQEQPTAPQQHLVPLRELLDTRERAQTAERERQELQRRLEAYERQQQQAQQKPAEVPDMFADPQAYTQHLQRSFEERLATMQLETNLQLAEVRHGETFGKAYESFIGEVGRGQNPALYHQVMRSPNPGEAMVGWFKQQEVLKTVGTDPAAYRQKLQDELLSDPAFLAQAIERARSGQSQPNTNGSRPQNVTRLPPSLNRQTSAAPARDADDGDGSEEAIWDAARDAQGRFTGR